MGGRPHCSERLTGEHDVSSSSFPYSAAELDQFRQVQRLASDIALTFESQLQAGMTRSQAAAIEQQADFWLQQHMPNWKPSAGR